MVKVHPLQFPNQYKGYMHEAHLDAIIAIVILNSYTLTVLVCC